MSESRLSPTAYVLIGIAIGGLAGACAAGADQPNMQAALGSLQQARSYLVQSTPNKGGHRERAIDRSLTSSRLNSKSDTVAARPVLDS